MAQGMIIKRDGRGRAIAEETGATLKGQVHFLTGYKEKAAFSSKDRDNFVCLWEIKKGGGEM